MNSRNAIPVDEAGFTLVEIAVVLLIVGLLLGGLLPTLSGQIENRRIAEAGKQLDEIKQALIGYAISNGRLPCPAAPGSANGVESFDIPGGGNAANGKCSNFYDGLLPAVTLGLTPVDSQGFAPDPWNNRIHYAVTNATATVATINGGQPFDIFTTLNGMSAASNVLATKPDLLVCSSATAAGFTVDTNCGTNNTLASTIPVVIYYTGKNGGSGGTGLDEKQNPNPNSTVLPDRLFISHAPVLDPAAPNGEFDDMVIWLPPGLLSYNLLQAGKL